VVGAALVVGNDELGRLHASVISPMLTQAPVVSFFELNPFTCLYVKRHQPNIRPFSKGARALMVHPIGLLHTVVRCIVLVGF